MSATRWVTTALIGAAAAGTLLISRSDAAEDARGARVGAGSARLGASSSAARARITGGYVITHEHPTYGTAFGGNYAFAGAAGNFRNGIMDKGYTAACGGCAPLEVCDHGEAKGELCRRKERMSGRLGTPGMLTGAKAL